MTQIGQPFNKLNEFVERANKPSGVAAYDLSGFISCPKGVRNEADGVATGDPEDAI
jgi:hypothetical protein